MVRCTLRSRTLKRNDVRLSSAVEMRETMPFAKIGLRTVLVLSYPNFLRPSNKYRRISVMAVAECYYWSGCLELSMKCKEEECCRSNAKLPESLKEVRQYAAVRTLIRNKV